MKGREEEREKRECGREDEIEGRRKVGGNR